MRTWLVRGAAAILCAAALSAMALGEEKLPRLPGAGGPVTTADAIVSPEEEAELLKRVVWPSHEPLAFLRRRGGLNRGYEAEYERYHTPENAAIVARLLGPGGMYTTHFYKGMGLKREAEEMERGLALAAELRRNGMGVSLYIGGTLHSPTVYEDHPESREWECVTADGQPIPYMMAGQGWRHYPCINNPGYRAFVRRLCDLVLERGDPDLIWFDNNILRPEPRSCRCRHCLEKFARRLTTKYGERERVERFGSADLGGLRPPTWPPAQAPGVLSEIPDPVLQEWIDFRCHSVRDFFEETVAYIRKRKPDCLIALNIKGIYASNLCYATGIDHGRWDLRLINSCDSGVRVSVGPKGNLIGEFRSYKASHSTGLSFIDGHSDRGNLLGIVMNRQIRSPRLGCVPANGHTMYTFGALGRFLKTRNDVLYGERPIYADVAMLRSWPSMAYNGINWRHGPYICEQGLWEARIPFGIIFDQSLADLSAHRVILLANQDALSDEAVARIKAFVEGGGGLVATGATGRLDHWRRERKVNALAEAFGLTVGAKPVQMAVGRGRAAYLPNLEAQADAGLPPKNWEEVESALRWAAGGAFRFAVRAPRAVAAEYRQGPTPQDRVVHLLNFAKEPQHDPTQVEMDDEGHDWTLELDSPDPLPKDVPAVTRSPGRVAFTVPGVGVYTACILRPAAEVRSGR